MTRVLPKGWEEKTLGEVCSFNRGLTYKKSDEVSLSSNVVLRANNIDLSTNSLNFDELKYLSPNFEIPADKKVQKDCLLICTASGSKSHLGKVALIDKDYGYAFGGFMGLLLPDKFIDSHYLFYALTSKPYFDFVSHLTDGANINNLKWSQLQDFKLIIPSLPEQKQIVEKLDKIFADIDKAKENTQKNLANAKEVFAVRLNCILENPKKTWEQRTFAEICDVRDGTHDSPKYLKEGYSLLTSKNLKNGELVFDKIKYISREDYEHINERSKVDIGDVLFAMIGTIGNPVVVTEEPNYAIKNMALFKHSKQLNPFFLKYLLESNLILNKMQKEANGTTQKFVSLGYLRKFPILLPPTEEQEQIVAELDSLRAKAQELKQIYTKKLADLDELKQSVLQQAFSGKL